MAPRGVDHTETTWDPNQLIGTLRNWPNITTSDGANWPIIAGGADDGDAGNSGDGDGTSSGNDDGTSANNDEGKTGNEKLFTQDQLNAIATAEANKARRGLVSPKDLGFESAKEMKDWVDSQKAKAEEDKSEDEKAREAAIEEAKRAAEESVLSKANERLRKAEFLSEAVNHQINREARDDAYLLAQTLEEWGNVDVNDEGVVTGFDDAFFDALKEAKPYLFATAEGEGGNGLGDIGAGQRGGGDSDSAKLQDLKNKYSALR